MQPRSSIKHHMTRQAAPQTELHVYKSLQMFMLQAIATHKGQRTSNLTMPVSQAKGTGGRSLSLICRSLQSRCRLTRYDCSNALQLHLSNPQYSAAKVSLQICNLVWVASRTWLSVSSQMQAVRSIHYLQDAAMHKQQAAQREAADRRARVAEVQRQRKQQTSLLRKKTRSGQPVMKHRIDKLLDALQH